MDAFQLSALCRLVGDAGMRQLGSVALDAACRAPMMLRDVLQKNGEALGAIASTFERKGELPSDAEVVLSVVNLPIVLASCRALGVALVARSLLQEGVRSAKGELLPGVVASFVSGLGSQQLPDGARAGQQLSPVMDLLEGYGQLGGGFMDAPLLDAVASQCRVADEPQLWAQLPYLIALVFTLPEWHGIGVSLEDDRLAGNAHCLVHALHALLCLCEPHMPRAYGEVEPVSEAGQRKAAHRRFVQLVSLILLEKRRALTEGGGGGGSKEAREAAAKERAIAAMVLVLEQLIQVAEPLGYGDLQRSVPASLMLASYAAVAQPLQVENERSVHNKAGGGGSPMGGGGGGGGAGAAGGSAEGIDVSDYQPAARSRMSMPTGGGMFRRSVGGD